MFATLVGTDTESGRHKTIFDSLIGMAKDRGFIAGSKVLHVEPDQLPIPGWSLALRGPDAGDAEFLLAVTAPKVPSISPIPVKKTVSGPLFAVVVMNDFLGIWRGGDFAEVKRPTQVESEFSAFLDVISVEVLKDGGLSVCQTTIFGLMSQAGGSA